MKLTDSLNWHRVTQAVPSWVYLVGYPIALILMLLYSGLRYCAWCCLVVPVLAFISFFGHLRIFFLGTTTRLLSIDSDRCEKYQIERRRLGGNIWMVIDYSHGPLKSLLDEYLDNHEFEYRVKRVKNDQFSEKE
jgi:hypothetical protein